MLYETGDTHGRDGQDSPEMHELSIAESIISTVRSEMESNSYVTVSGIGLRIGEMTDIVEDSLRFGLEAFTKGTNLEGVEVTIEIIPLQGKCKQCQREFRIVEFKFVCPNCKGVEIEVIMGKELDISYLEVETDIKQET